MLQSLYTTFQTSLLFNFSRLFGNPRLSVIFVHSMLRYRKARCDISCKENTFSQIFEESC